MDPIDQVLEGLRLQGSVFSRMELGAGWGFSKECLGGAPFHLVIEGEAWVGHDADDLVRLGVGEMAIFPRGEAHLLLSAHDAEALPFHRIAVDIGLPEWRPGIRLKPRVLRFGTNGPPVTRLVSGIFEFADRRRNPLLSALPDILMLRGISGERARTTIRTVAMTIDHEVEASAPGARLVAARLADYLFVEAVREHLVSNGRDDRGWLRGLGDPLVGRALSLIHADPGRDWSVDLLAIEVGASRSQFAQRFRALVERGPIEYLREWRMFLASAHLAEAQMPLKEIARRAGYRSVPAFGRAFKLWAGEPPAAVRRTRQAVAAVQR
ncbi:AraC family transcriptional regulator [Sphingomonas sp. Y38-1Y]|uniref:AraC family transcriptional regulator n=1 Tax=Sphingomonas sp. Y38-1Y TaxID=3078265 RepID=UPI0028E28F38|nr:AraC family transcriptional regulator [Sphingomonas sp. Y38-1Y]